MLLLRGATRAAVRGTRGAATAAAAAAEVSPAAASLLAQEDAHSAHNYHPLSVVLERGEGLFVWDVDGKRYYDFLSAYSAVNQGHCHPRIVQALTEQAQTLTLTSRAFHNNLLGQYAQYMYETFGYDKVLPMNTGVEASETSVKIARKWGYEKKGVPKDQARVLFAEGNFWGRSIAAVSASTDPSSYEGFGPFVPNFDTVPYNDADAVEEALSRDPNYVAYMFEPIQGEAGVVVPSEGYVQRIAEICKRHNVLLIADEVQTGLGRTGYMLATEHDGVRPDLVCLGKALSGGTLPVSAVLADNDVMDVITPGTHGSTYGGNPLACRVAMAALDVLVDEGLCENARVQGERLRAGLESMESDWIQLVRGRGLLNAIVIREGEGDPAWRLCEEFKANGLIAKPTHENKIRFAPPLTINSEQVDEALEIIHTSLRNFQAA